MPSETRYLVVLGFASEKRQVLGPYKTESDAQIAKKTVEQMDYPEGHNVTWGEGDTWVKIRERETIDGDKRGVEIDDLWDESSIVVPSTDRTWTEEPLVPFWDSGIRCGSGNGTLFQRTEHDSSPSTTGEVEVNGKKSAEITDIEINKPTAPIRDLY